jgi:hypothetical protein
MKNVYEIFDEFEAAGNKQERMEVIGKNLSRMLTEVFLFGYHPDYEWHFKEMPDNYRPKDVPQGMSYLQLSTELRKFYLYRKGDPTSDKLTTEKRTQLLLELLENLEPREAEVVMGIFNKDFGVKGLNYKFVKEAFPNLLP